jgi:hypothetical protein
MTDEPPITAEQVERIRLDLDKYAAGARLRAEDKLVGEVLLMFVRAHSRIDTFSNLLLLIAGGTLGLFISNLDASSRLLWPEGQRLVLALLIVSALFGLIEKWTALTTETAVNGINEAQALLPLFSGEPPHDGATADADLIGHTFDLEPNVPAAFARIAQAMPWYAFPLRGSVRANVKRGLNDNLYAHKTALRHFLRQSFWTFLQIIAFLLASLAVAYCAY